MNPTQFLKEIQTIPTGTGNAGGGDGFKKSYPLTLSDVTLSTGLAITTGTNPLIATFESHFVGIQVAASQTSAGMLTLVLPPDYDGETLGNAANTNPVPGGGDFLQVVLYAQSAGTTNTPTISGTLYYKRPGKALSAQIASNVMTGANLARYPNVVPVSTANVAQCFVDFSGNGFQANDEVQINIVTSAHTTDAVNIYGFDIYYKSNLVFSNMANRAQ